MKYVVREKPASSQTVIHVLGKCHGEQDSGLRSLNAVSDYYGTLAQAERAAKKTGSRLIRRCRICFPRRT
ncbi:MAG: hypothetical protein OXG11_11270 [Chloroflexi bacterium]|nr:hypothetical protein [Chloroflexota bacterium]